MIPIPVFADDRCLASIIMEEGLVTHTYEDTNEKGEVQIANGIGNAEPGLVPGTIITPEEAVAKLRENFVRFVEVVNRVFSRQLKQQEANAMFSRAFNKGVAGFEGTHGHPGLKRLIDRVNVNDTRAAMVALVDAGNTARRLREGLIYTSNYYRDFSKVPLFEGNPKLVKARWIDNPIKVDR